MNNKNRSFAHNGTQLLRHRVPDSRFEVQQRLKDGHKRLVSLAEFAPGEIVNRFSALKRRSSPTVHSVQVSASEHILLQPEFLRYINHSCSPNLFFDVKRMLLTAIEPIQAGEEVVFFYPSTEVSMVHPFVCECGEQRCLGTISGAAHLPAEILKQYDLSEHVEALLAHRVSEDFGTAWGVSLA